MLSRKSSAKINRVLYLGRNQQNKFVEKVDKIHNNICSNEVLVTKDDNGTAIYCNTDMENINRYNPYYL
jgi:hypothetical protein